MNISGISIITGDVPKPSAKDPIDGDYYGEDGGYKPRELRKDPIIGEGSEWN